ncbi:zinc finger BED domain-containing protein RICESLEEPER 2-like [Rosa rugosa]|uniref:zinc finger BED domain-containing protein RICESLEEPER 2-like n=1 Tax=Rosa rugosa TaxID=74645 RepID=UPI002B41104F|nr:zinc finger BED domain-containing protein RICESLEEPER 2-like [Rosa rugosa]
MLDRSVGSIQNAVKFFRSSSSRFELFKKCVEKEKLESKKICVLDVPTRWNSAFIMLETSIELKKAFNRMADEEDSKYNSYFDEPEREDTDGEEDCFMVVDPKSRKRIGPPNDHDWEKAAIFVQFLKVFYEVTLRVSATNRPTSHRAFHDIVSIKAEIEDLFDRDEEDFEHKAHKTLYQMAVKMKAKFTKYFAKLEDMNQLLLVALVLDPRYKLRNFGRTCRDMLGYDGSQVKKASEELKELIVQLTDLYASSNGPQKELRESEEVVVQHEVDRYCLDPIEDPPKEEDWDILMWWKLNGVKYPNLQLVAKDVLAVQVNTVASESAFSTRGRVIDPYRSSMTPRTVEALICMQNWINSTSISEIEYFPTTEEFEFYEKMEREHQLEDTASSEKGRAGRLSKAAKITINIDAAVDSNISS